MDFIYLLKDLQNKLFRNSKILLKLQLNQQLSIVLVCGQDFCMLILKFQNLVCLNYFN